MKCLISLIEKENYYLINMKKYIDNKQKYITYTLSNEKKKMKKKIFMFFNFSNIKFYYILLIHLQQFKLMDV